MFCYSVTRPANLDRLFEGDFALERLGVDRVVLGFTSSSLGEVSLVPLSLSVGEVVSLVVVKGEAELALVAAEVVAHKVGILG